MYVLQHWAGHQNAKPKVCFIRTVFLEQTLTKPILTKMTRQTSYVCVCMEL